MPGRIRLPFTMWVLQGAVKMVWSLLGVMRVACTFMLVMLLWLALWSFGAAGVVASSMGDDGRWWLLVVFSVSLFWMSAVLCNTVHVIVSGMVFLVLLHGGQEAASMPSKPLMKLGDSDQRLATMCVCCAVLIFLFYLVETLVRFFNKYAYVQVESSVSAPTDGQNTRGRPLGKATEALPLPAFSNWAWQMQSHNVVLKSTVVDIFIEF
ncbi:hypothetical protein HYC85_013122 [Camellia sinensis]|uniref:Choline transporter-like protein n=1 Tax=Camellia sinensis TaxID=4442 RepID=A0A7J7H3R1_CAMSI|nr:hypothetical protein HYC85_013122 [Camellia sinensis]